VIDPGDFARFPERPPSEVEWEELLVKYEIAPRAVRLAVGDAPGDGVALLGPLSLLLAWELWTAEALAAMRDGRALAGDGAGVESAAEAGARGLVDGYAAARARNFAMLQRRGIDVWDWAVDDGGTRITPYRLLQAAVAGDGRALAAVRAAVGA